MHRQGNEQKQVAVHQILNPHQSGHQDFKFGVLLLVFVRFLGGDTGNLLKVDRVFISFMLKGVNLSILQKTINKTSNSPHVFAMCSIRTDLLKQENGKIDSL
jgi:hypothetical protein